MIIQELKPSKRVRGRWLAVLEDGSLLRVGEGEVLQFSLCAGRELTEGEAERLLLPVDAYFRDHPALTVGLREERAARNGAAFPWRGADGTYRVYGPAGDFLLLGELERGRMRTVKSFYEV